MVDGKWLILGWRLIRSKENPGQFGIKEALKHLVFAVAAGIACGLSSVVLCLAAQWAFLAFTTFPLLIWLLPVMGIVQLAAYRLLGLKPDLTTGKVVDAVRRDDLIEPTLAPGILFGTATTLLSGGSVGKEAGALQMGASVGASVSKPFKLRRITKGNDRTLGGYIGALGMAAEFAALFFAPIGSALFILELTHYKKSVFAYFPYILLACFCAYAVAWLIGVGDFIDAVAVPGYTWHTLAICIVIGVVCAVMATVTVASIGALHTLTLKATNCIYVWVAIGGVLFAVLVTVFGWMPYTGSGGATLNDALNGNFQMHGFAVKALLTVICLGFWFKGGEITPSFCIGGLLGATFASLLGADVEFGVAVGVISFFAAFSRCPLAAFAMGCEILGWQMAPYFAIAVIVAFSSSMSIGMYGEGADRRIRAHIKKLLK